MSHNRRISRLIQDDSLRWEALLVVESMRLPSGCIGAGFVRNLVWDHLHGRVSDCRHEDVDVLYYDPVRVRREHEEEFESILTAAIPELSWSVRNQARMHVRNNDLPYSSVDDAMSFWPETATAVAASSEGSTCKISAPHGLDDLMGLILRPTSRRQDRVALFHERIASKNWLVRWPRLVLLECR